MSLNNKIAIITGGAGGIGEGICHALAAKGAKIIVNCLESEYADAKRITDGIKNCGGTAIEISGDVTDEKCVEALIDTAIKEFGKIDILVNCAGITIDGVTKRISKNDFEKVLGVNLIGPFLTMKAALKYMIPQKCGRIINISSVAGLVGLIGAPAYSASKAGLIGLSKSTAKEVALKGITVNVICPGYINAGITKKGEYDKTFIDGKLRSVPMSRLGEARDIGEGVAYLASDEANYITGEVIRIDGGMAM